MLFGAGCMPAALAGDDVLDWQMRWRYVYAREFYAETGKWVHGQFDWHVFSFGKHKAKEGDDAWAEYRRLEPCTFLVLSAYVHDSFGFKCEGKPPDRLKAGLDIIITSPSLEWTMSFNHEQYGPYFAVPSGDVPDVC